MALISRKLLQKRPQELGRIKIGGLGPELTSKKGKKFQPPVKYEHFVVTTMKRGADGNFIRDEAIHAKVGDQPTELSGVLMFETPEENFHAEMVQYQGRGSKGKVWSCDGETAQNLKSGGSGPCLKANGKECACKPYARFHIQLLDSPHTLGYHVFRTTSWESTNNIQGVLEEIHARFRTCYGAPVKLVCYPSEDNHDGGSSTSLKVGLVLAMGMRDAAERIGQSREYLRLASGEVKQLAAGVQADQEARDAEEAAHIADEFFPPSTAEVLADALAEDEEEDAPLVGGPGTPLDSAPTADNEEL